MKAVLLRRRKLGLGSCNGIKVFSKTGIDWVRNDRPMPAADMVFRWGTTSNIVGKPVIVNEAKAIHWAADKRGSRAILAEAGLAPKTWLSFNDLADDLDNYPEEVVLRRATHHQGRFLHHVEIWADPDISMEELCDLADKYGEGNYYISEYIPKVAEYRVFLVQGRVVWVAKKTPDNPDAIAWNVAKGGRFDNVRWDDWPLRAVRVAREAFLLSGLDFGGVDIMIDKDGKCYVLEINSAPSQTSPYRQECTAKAFDWIVEHGKAPIPVIEERGGYAKFIHPAISERAILV